MSQFNFSNLVACPSCKGELEISDSAVRCNSCDIDYRTDGDKLFTLIDTNQYSADEKQFVESMEGFWGEGWGSRVNNDADHAHLTRSKEEVKKYFDSTYKEDEIYQVNERHPYYSSGLFSYEVKFDELKGKTILNIGCGCGTESAKLSYWGDSNTIPVDITYNAAKSSQQVLRRLDCRSDYAIQADARFLPIKSNSIDYVYTSGVLHHSPNIEKSFAEIHRVLKPGGKAYIGLYGKTSLQFMVIVLKGILKGNFSKKAIEKFVNKNTEQAWETGSGNLNPRTDLFSRSECFELAKDFSDVKIRSNGLIYLHIPKIGKYIEKLRPSFIPPGLPIGGNNYITATK